MRVTHATASRSGPFLRLQISDTPLIEDQADMRETSYECFTSRCGKGKRVGGPVLLNRGANVNAREGRYKTVLQAAGNGGK